MGILAWMHLRRLNPQIPKLSGPAEMAQPPLLTDKAPFLPSLLLESHASASDKASALQHNAGSSQDLPLLPCLADQGTERDLTINPVLAQVMRDSQS